MSDQMRCDLCNLTWDINDPEPPTCGVATIPLGGFIPALPETHVDEELRGLISGVEDGERVAASRLRRVYRNAHPKIAEAAKVFEHGGHVLYTDADQDAPLCVRDGNGQVVLALCKNCNQGEADLASVCPNPPKLPSTFSARGLAIIAQIGSALDAPTETPAPVLQCLGVSRVFGTGTQHWNTPQPELRLIFSRVPTDAELQHFHDLIRHNTPKR
jgi:hypothetical protein